MHILVFWILFVSAVTMVAAWTDSLWLSYVALASYVATIVASIIFFLFWVL